MQKILAPFYFRYKLAYHTYDESYNQHGNYRLKKLYELVNTKVGFFSDQIRAISILFCRFCSKSIMKAIEQVKENKAI